MAKNKEDPNKWIHDLMEPGISAFKAQCTELVEIESASKLLKNPVFVAPANISETSEYGLGAESNLMVIAIRARTADGIPYFRKPQERQTFVKIGLKYYDSKAVVEVATDVLAAFGEIKVDDTQEDNEYDYPDVPELPDDGAHVDTNGPEPTDMSDAVPGGHDEAAAILQTSEMIHTPNVDQALKN